MSAVVLASDFKAANVTFKEPRKNAVGGQSILLNYYNEATKKNGPLVIQTPKVRMPFGLDVNESDTGAKKYSINVSLAGKECENVNLKVFTQLIHDLDDLTKNTACELSEEWFGKKQKAEVLDEFYKSAEKKSKNDKYPSTLKLKLPFKSVGDKGIPQFDIYNESRELVNVITESDVDLSCLEKGGEIVAIIQCTGVWFVGKTQFGLGWKVVQVKTYRTQKLVGCCIVDEDPDEEVEEEEEEVEEEEEEVEPE
jgi:hypothetical protein